MPFGSLAGMRYLEPIAHLALLLVAFLACASGGEKDTAKKPSGPPIEPEDVCAKLAAAKAVRNCGAPSVGALGSTVKFDVPGAAGPRGTVAKYESADEFSHFAQSWSKFAADDYPQQAGIWPSTHIIVSWGASLDDKDPEGDKWEDCRQRRKRPVAECAKAQPAYYAAHKAMYEAVKRVLSSR